MRAAQALVEELPAASETSIGALAACSENNAERALHALSAKFKLTLPVEICPLMGVHDEMIPYLPLSSWARAIMSKNLWFSLSGLDAPDAERSAAQWTLFWDNFRQLHPSHPVCSRSREDLSRTAAIILHGDEGRSRKKTAILILAAHSALGRGTGLQGSEAKEFAHQRLNYAGNTLCTRWLLAALPRYMYEDERGPNLQIVLRTLVEDMNGLLNAGIKGLDGKTYYMAVVHCIGDWPWLAKAFEFQRSFSNSAKQPSSKTAARGICHVCLADQANLPWEDFDSEEPRWRATCNLVRRFRHRRHSLICHTTRRT